MAYRILITPKAQRQIKAMPVSIQDRIRSTVRALRDNPYPPGTRKLKDAEGQYRIRVGDYRIVYVVEGRLLMVLVVTVGHRKDVYEQLLKKYPLEHFLAVLKDEK